MTMGGTFAGNFFHMPHLGDGGYYFILTTPKNYTLNLNQSLYKKKNNNNKQ